jgi:hypothetical protein
MTDASHPTLPAPSAKPPVGPTARTYTRRIVMIYVALGAVVLGAVVLFFAFVLNASFSSSSSNKAAGAKSWAPWTPAEGNTATMAREIANHVANEYKLNKNGSQLVDVVSTRPSVTADTHKISISTIALNKGGGDNVVPTNATWSEQFCGLGAECSIATGQATQARGRLVRREALELALYTFKFVPAINSIVAFMPPPPGHAPSTLLYLQKNDFAKQLALPLTKTLPLVKPPLPTSSDPTERTTIDKLTLPMVYTFKVQQLQDASAVLILSPFKS